MKRMPNRNGLSLVRRPVARAEASSATLREATTGRMVLARVWAVGEKRTAAVKPLELVPAPVSEEMEKPEPRPELAFYRKYTEAMLRRYLRMSMSNGRVPSLLGRELFRGHVTHYAVSGFDDVAIFCMDVEKCLKQLTVAELAIVKRVGVQQYTHEEAAGLLGFTDRHVRRTYGPTLDKLTAIFLQTGLMEPLKSCQGGKEVMVGVS